MSKKQAFITISISVCFLTGIIYFSLLELKESACLESFYLRSAYLEREIAKLKKEIIKLDIEKEGLLNNVANLQKELKGEEEKDTPLAIKQDLNVSFREPIRIISHEVYRESRPHTLESFLKAVELGVYGIEANVQFTKDHIPVLFYASDILYTLGEIKNNILTLDEVIGFLDGKVGLFIIDTYHMFSPWPEDLSLKEASDITENIISKYNAEDFVVIQTPSKEFLKYIDFNKYKVAWNTFEIQSDYKISFYTLNPSWEINHEKIKEVHRVGAEVIPVCVVYSDIGSEEEYYPITLLSGSKYIMVGDIEKFKEFCEKYNIPIYGKK